MRTGNPKSPINTKSQKGHQSHFDQDQIQKKDAPFFEKTPSNPFFNPISPIQKKETEKEELKMKEQTIQKKANKTGLPDNLKSGVENLSGYSMDDVKVHYNSDKPAQLQAHAYAQGTDIYLASGQEKHLPHEAWHVVQQKQGRVQPTVQMKDEVNINDDTSLEKEADVMGGKSLTVQKKTLTNPPIQHFHSSDIVQRMVLVNAVVTNNTYKSQPHGGNVYHMIVDPSLDDELKVHIEKAKAFASAGSNRHERLGLLFQYVDSLNKDEKGRDDIYVPTGEQDEDGNNIREALLGTCLNVAAACRELSAFLQLLLAEEGVRTDNTVGYVGGMFNAQRHAWLQIPNDDDSVIDPTMTRVGLKPRDYRPEKNANLSVPNQEGPVNIERMQDAAYKTAVRNLREIVLRKPKTLREKANENLEEYSKRRDTLIKEIKQMIGRSPTLTNLIKEGVINFELITQKSMDELNTEIIPELHELAQWPKNPGSAL